MYGQHMEVVQTYDFSESAFPLLDEASELFYEDIQDKVPDVPGWSRLDCILFWLTDAFHKPLNDFYRKGGRSLTELFPESFVRSVDALLLKELISRLSRPLKSFLATV